jgi:hypothetical protein
MSETVETPEEVVQPETIPTPTPVDDAAVMEGGPGIGEDAPQAATGQDVASYVTKNDLLDMERRLVDSGLKSISEEAKEVRAATTAPTTDGTDKEFAQKVADLWFTQPDEALRLLDERNDKKLQARDDKQKTTANFWESFYQQNPVLHRHKRVVQFVMNENYGDLAEMPANDAKKILAEKAMSFISDVAQSTGGKVETLSSANPEALRASGDPTPSVKPKTEKVVSFCDQVQNLHKKKMSLQK